MPLYWGGVDREPVKLTHHLRPSPEWLLVLVGVWAMTMYAAYTLGWWMGVYDAF